MKSFGVPNREVGAKYPVHGYPQESSRGVFRHRQQLDGGVAHVLHIGSQLPGQIFIVDEVPVVPLAPGAQVDLIDIQRRCIDRVLGLFLPKSAVRPLESADVVQLAGRRRPGLRVEAVGVRLLADLTVRPADRIFIGGIDRQVRQESLPDLPPAGQGRRPLLPVVEIAHDGHRLRMGRPHPERPARPSPPGGRMGAEPAPAVRQRSLMETVRLSLLCHGSSSSPCRRGAPAGSLVFFFPGAVGAGSGYTWNWFYYTSWAKYRQGWSCRKRVPQIGGISQFFSAFSQECLSVFVGRARIFPGTFGFLISS